MKRTVIAIFMAMLLSSMLCSVFKIVPAEAAGTIYIRADGSIDPLTPLISTLDNVTYAFTGNIDDSIVVERDNIIVDGGGYTLLGTGAISSKGVDLSGRTNVTVQKTQIKNFYSGIELGDSFNNSVSRNNIANNVEGVSLNHSSGNTVSGNNITANTYCVNLDSSSSNTFLGNSMANNGKGVCVVYSFGNTFSANNINGPSMYGLNFNSCSGNTVSGNNITANDNGIKLYYSSNIIVFGNNIANNVRGIELYSSSGNIIHHNNFVDNTQQASVFPSGDSNVWDNGYTSGGNYWSDLNPPDIYSGPYQNETGRDKIGDTPYIIDENNTDNYPLIYPYGYVPSPDFNNDGITDIFDIVRIALAFGSVPGMPNWDPYVDLNQDGIIDIFDLVVVALHFGETG